MPDIEWSPARRVAFRFAAVYFFLYLFPFPLNALPFDWLSSWWDALCEAMAKWTALHLFGIKIEPAFTGSGDSTFHYVLVFCSVAAAALAAIVWTALDGRKNYGTLHVWLRVYIRFGLAAIMFGYGAAKVIQSQFPAPRLDRLMQPIGFGSPMGLLWTFMGASAAYNLFTGAGEMLGGLLLTMRRTTTLGALLCIAVMSNVVMLNFAYDVPVKLHSLHLLAMSVFLLLPDLGRLANVLVFNRPAAAAELRPQLSERWRRWAPAGRAAFVLLLAALALQAAHESRQRRIEESPFRGVWNVEELAIDGQPRPPLLTDASRWRRVILDRPNFFAVQLMDDAPLRYQLKLDPAKRTMTLSNFFEKETRGTLAYATPSPGLMTLDGVIEGKKVRARLQRTPPPSFLLTSRGFHWINEYPLNR
jgi:hypothetical protein